MINYYRASVRQSQKEAAAKLRPLSAPTLVIWGERDSYLGSGPCRAPQRRCAQPRSRRAPGRRVALGASRRSRTGQRTVDRLLRSRAPGVGSERRAEDEGMLDPQMRSPLRNTGCVSESRMGSISTEGAMASTRERPVSRVPVAANPLMTGEVVNERNRRERNRRPAIPHRWPETSKSMICAVVFAAARLPSKELVDDRSQGVQLFDDSGARPLLGERLRLSGGSKRG